MKRLLGRRRWPPIGALVAIVAVVLAAAGAGAGAAAAANPLDVEVVQTSSNLDQRLTRLPDLLFAPISARGAPARTTPVIHINDLVHYQRVGGFGAAMTDSSAWLLYDELPPSIGDPVMNALFGTSGIHLSSVRVPMGASDFTRDGRPYTYDDLPAGRSDPSLSHFSIAHDRAYILPELRQALALNPAAKMLATPWAPPAWMKSNDSLANVRHSGTLRLAAFQPLARYFVKFIQAYRRAGLPIAAVSPASEPTNATGYPGLELSEPAEARWIKRNLAPALRAAHLNTNIYGHDSGWSTISAAYAKKLVADRALDRALTGIAWHCYYGSPNLMSTVHDMAPALQQIVDECSPGITPFPTAEVVIGSIRNWASTVELWNLALDPHGGPVQARNTGCPACSGLVTVDEQTHTATFGLSYYQLGQASAFVQPGASRVESDHFVFYDYQRPGVNLVTPGLDDVAFINPDGSQVLVAYDNSTHQISFAVDWQGRSVMYTLPSRAMVTLVWNRKR